MAVLSTIVEYLERDFTRLIFRKAATPLAATGAATNKLTVTTTTIANGDEVSLSSIVTLTNVAVNVIYYVVGRTATDIQLALTVGGAAIVIGNTGSANVLTYADYEVNYPNQATANSTTQDYEWRGGGKRVTLSILDGLTFDIDSASVPSYVISKVFAKDEVTIGGASNVIGFGGGSDQEGVTIGLWMERNAKKLVNGVETGVVTRFYYAPAGTLTPRAAPGLQDGDVGSLLGWSFSATPGNADVNGGVIPGMDAEDFYAHGELA